MTDTTLPKARTPNGGDAPETVWQDVVYDALLGHPGEMMTVRLDGEPMFVVMTWQMYQQLVDAGALKDVS